MLHRIFLLTLLVVLASSELVQAQWLGQKRISPFGSNDEYVEPIELTDQAESGWMHWNWRPQPIEWKQPEFIRRMNANSMRAWNNTRRTVGHWASTTNSAIRNSARNTWDTLTQANSRREREDESSLAPNNRAVNDFLSRPRVKF